MFALCGLSLATLSLSTAQTSTSTVACEVSEGDKSFGVRVVDDVGCLNGGLGCYNDHCRYCKLIDTPKSTQFESCSSFGASFTTMATLTAPTGPCEISVGDAAVGIAAVSDTDCLYGGLGCFKDHCRFCKLNETAESTAFIDCNKMNTTTIVTDGTPTTPIPAFTGTNVPSNGSVCSIKVSEGDAAVGIKIVTDNTCAGGGIGCIDEVCRYCRLTTTVQSATFIDCHTVANFVVGDDKPAEPSTEVPTEIPTEAPLVTGTCQQVAAEGDIKAGIIIVPDDSCATGGIGCISDVCRYCRLVYTQQSAAFNDCRTVLSPNTFIPLTGTAPPSSGTSIDIDGSTQTPTSSVTEAPITHPACTQVISSGDASVGINIVSDASCVNGGLGCIDAVCRFCQVFKTTQSSTFPDCTSIDGYSAGVDTTTNVSKPNSDSIDTDTEAPTESPVVNDTPSSVGAICTQIQSDGDAAVGINIYTDTSCANGGVGCIDDICRFCKVTSTEQSASFVDCPSVDA
ncbi:uncharacterized protein PHALS_04084 [Plasmopara halstedii]|uniref:RxLR-like protein n=1 Tax=Plasmopara halstedii TaxID=4781 RepID=A0A0P1A8F5_PLAHL|nr:uncharacterized protein PHALS_04084 [Plasmopara halstedii]CEG36828.1 hypothetical protein PHALS_04084 [Plasmopara halstedii]|eukprot:XP_024573197.1 hypothetical protein PHALS_04084 [Plasmopara halstedii]